MQIGGIQMQKGKVILRTELLHWWDGIFEIVHIVCHPKFNDFNVVKVSLGDMLIYTDGDVKSEYIQCDNYIEAMKVVDSLVSRAKLSRENKDIIEL